MLPAIHLDLGARDIAALTRAQEIDHIRHLRRLTKPPHRQFLDDLAGALTQDTGFDLSRCNRIHPNPQRPEIMGHFPCERGKGRLGRRIGRPGKRVNAGPCNGGDIDDGPLRLCELLFQPASQNHRREEIDVKHLAPVAQIGVQRAEPFSRWPLGRDPCIVHQRIEAAIPRGARVVAAGQGCGRERFACPYHAWTYAADGRLRALPRAEGFPDLDPDQSGLRRLAVAERAGLVWVIPDPAVADVDVRAMLGAYAEELESFGLHHHVAYGQRDIELRCDWKLIVEGSSEAYHFKIAHRDTIAPLFVDNLQIVDEDGLHRRMFIVKEALREQPAPAQPEPRAVGNILYYLFPSTMVLVQPDHAQVTRIEPTALGRTQVFDIALIPAAPDNDRARSHWDRNVQLYRDTLAEDYAQMEAIHAGLESGANRELRFGRYEFALARFHVQLDAQLATGT